MARPVLLLSLMLITVIGDRSRPRLSLSWGVAWEVRRLVWVHVALPMTEWTSPSQPEALTTLRHSVPQTKAE